MKFSSLTRGFGNSSEEFYEFFEGIVVLTKMVGDKIFLAMSNMCLLNELIGIHMGFIVSFHQVSMPNFTDVFLVKVAATQREEYLAEELGLFF